METNYHTSVLFSESLEALIVVPGETYLDATLGGGGHTKGILDFGGQVIALDIDQDAIENAKKKFNLVSRDGVWVTKKGNLKIYKSNFQNLDLVAEEAQIKEFSGIIFDLGVSSFMLDTTERGFSFSRSGPLDMRMDQDLEVRAADLLNALNEGELYELFSKLGQEPYARRIAGDVVRYRVNKQFESTDELANLVRGVHKSNKKEIDPSTKVFMALRIAVNDELNALRSALPKATKLLKKGGRLVVISFHSLEDKIVKDHLKNDKNLVAITDKPITASNEEIRINKRSRSAKMRVAEKK